MTMRTPPKDQRNNLHTFDFLLLALKCVIKHFRGRSAKQFIVPIISFARLELLKLGSFISAVLHNLSEQMTRNLLNLNGVDKTSIKHNEIT